VPPLSDARTLIEDDHYGGRVAAAKMAGGGGAELVDGGAPAGGAAAMPEARPQALKSPAAWGAPELTVVIPTLNERENVPVLAAQLGEVLKGIAWEAIFVDDDSTDGTMDIIRHLSEGSPHIRGIRRVHRRGLAGALLEGMLASSAQFVAVIDADMQHDEQCLIDMLRILRAGEAEVVVGSRYLDGPGQSGLSRTRHFGSRLATRLSKPILRSALTDPMSGFFMIRREAIEKVAPALSHQGFKILLDILASSRTPLRVSEVPYEFRERLHGESKLDATVVLEYLGLIVAKLSRDLVSIRFLMFGTVGASGIVINLVVLALLLGQNVAFSVAQTAAMLTAMTSNYTLNNLLTYRDRRRRGWRFFTGLAVFAALCSVGLAAGVGVSTFIYAGESWWIAGLAGALVGTMWNYITNTMITWRIH
jgi:dolichol-phosphate mannosyltransferase